MWEYNMCLLFLKTKQFIKYQNFQKMYTLTLFKKKNVSFFINATVWFLRQYSLFLLAPDIKLCSSFTLYTFFYTFYMLFVYKYVWSVYRGIKIKSTNVYVFIWIVYFLFFLSFFSFFCFAFFVKKYFCFRLT